MKSEKAMEYVGRHNWPDEDTNIRAIYCYHVQDAIELAEQEAEERMREKAIEAFKSSCKYQDGCLGANRKCDQTQCADLNEFIQKLNEE
jgi:hypothetical protein